MNVQRTSVSALPRIGLCDATLTRLSPSVITPRYDRRSITAGVVHIGVGGFHRAHQAVYFDELATLGSTDWGVVGVGLHHDELGSTLTAQDHLWTVQERGATSSTARVVGVMTDWLHGASQPGAVLAALCDPATRLVTLTITGDAYNLDHRGAFRVNHPSVARELAHPDRPDCVFTYLVEALRRRRGNGTPPFTVLSCDNIPSNGGATRTMVVSFARLRDSGLADWIEENVAFPNSVVDRITPEATEHDLADVAHAVGVLDRCAVITEPFTQWVIEDRFGPQRPPLELVGVEFVDDVSGHELTKKRLLNGAHCAIGYLGTLAGHTTTAEVIADPVLNGYVRGLLDEVAALLPPTPGLDLDAYTSSVLERLGNPDMADDLGRLCRRGSTKMPAYLLPSIADSLAAGAECPMLTLALAGWFRYLRGVDDLGAPIEVVDPKRDSLLRLASLGGDDPRPLLSSDPVLQRLAGDPGFVTLLEQAAVDLSTGTRATLAQQLGVGARR